MTIIMTLDEFYNLSRDECFERIKGESRSQAKLRLCYGVALSLLLIACIVFIVIREPQEYEGYTNNFYICLLSILCIATAWFAVNNFRFLKVVDTLGAPKPLLHEYEKTMNNKRYAYYLFILGGIVSFYPEILYNFKYLDLNWTLLDLTFKVALIALWIYSFIVYEKRDYKTRRDEEIIDRLQDLIDKK